MQYIQISNLQEAVNISDWIHTWMDGLHYLVGEPTTCMDGLHYLVGETTTCMDGLHYLIGKTTTWLAELPKGLRHPQLRTWALYPHIPPSSLYQPTVYLMGETTTWVEVSIP